MRFTGELLLPSLDAAREAIKNYPDFDTTGYGRWACVLKETNTVIGFCGLKYLHAVKTGDQ
jgi:RimJ/RimL family protein N-acetyltransferase